MATVINKTGTIEITITDTTSDVTFFDNLIKVNTEMQVINEEFHFLETKVDEAGDNEIVTTIIPAAEVTDPAGNTETKAGIIQGYLEDIPLPTGILAFGEVFMQDNLTNTVISVINTPVKVLGATMAGNLADFEHSDNRITYRGDETKVFHFVAAMSASRVGGGSEDYTFYFAVNDIVQNKTHIRRTLTSSGGSISLTGLLSLDTNDYVELWVENNSGTGDALVEDINYNTRA